MTELGYQDGIEVSGEAVDIYRPQVLLADFALSRTRQKAQFGDLWCAVAKCNLYDEIRSR